LAFQKPTKDKIISERDRSFSWIRISFQFEPSLARTILGCKKVQDEVAIAFRRVCKDK